MGGVFMAQYISPEDASQIIRQIVYGTLNNSPNRDELLRLKEFLLTLQREAQIKYLCENFSVEELRSMGFNI